MIVKKLRNENNWSQQELATLAGLNVRTIQRVESGLSASMETLKSLAAVFEIEVKQLTAVITTIDKNSELWQSQPWWFRLAFFGIASRKVQVFAECTIFILGLIALFTVENKFAVAGLFLASYLTGLSVKYGDRNQVW